MGKILVYFTVPLLLLLSNRSGNSAPQSTEIGQGLTGIQEKLIVARGNVLMDLDFDRLEGARGKTQESKREPVRFEVSPNSFFKIPRF